MGEVEVPQAAVEAVLTRCWGGLGAQTYTHAEHIFNGGCAVCAGDVETVLSVAAPHIAAAALRAAAEELWDRMDGERLAAIYAAWLRQRADQLDGGQQQEVVTDG